MQVTDACAPRVTASPFYTCRQHKRDFRPFRPQAAHRPRRARDRGRRAGRLRRRALPGPAAGRSSRRLWLVGRLCAGSPGKGAAGLCDPKRVAATGARANRAAISRSAMHTIDGARGAVNVVRRRNRRRFRDCAISVCAIAIGTHPPDTGQAEILISRATERPVWAPGARILVRPTIIRRRSRTSSIVDRAPIASVRWGGPTERRRSRHRSLGLRDLAGCPAPTAIAEWLHAQHGWVQAGPCQPSVGVAPDGIKGL